VTRTVHLNTEMGKQIRTLGPVARSAYCGAPQRAELKGRKRTFARRRMNSGGNLILLKGNYYSSPRESRSGKKGVENMAASFEGGLLTG